MSSPKKQCSIPVIGTHDGTFHCDEVLACWLLKQLPKYKDADILRTRDTPKLNKCDIVVDVGGVYDPVHFRFDHHQRQFNGTMNSLAKLKWTTKLSSAGLVYLHFGKEIISLLADLPADGNQVTKLYEKLYDGLIEEVDAIDNGIDQFDGEQRYKVTTNLSSRIGGLNPAWNEEVTDVSPLFNKAMEICGEVFTDKLNYYAKAWLPARKLVEKAIDDRHKVHDSGEIIVFECSGCPWKEHLFDYEEEKSITPSIKFVLYQDNAKNWRVQCVPLKLGSFDNRLSLCEPWRGIRDNALSSLSGIPGCIFVHAGGFIGGNKTYEGALEMAKKTLAERSKE